MKLVEAEVIAEWALSDYRPALAVAALHAVAAGLRRALGKGPTSRSAGRPLAPTPPGSLPYLAVALWAFVATLRTWSLHDTHSSVYPQQILVSAQVFLGALLVLAAVLGLVWLGDRLQGRDLVSRRAAPGLPWSMAILVLAPIADWLVATAGWWAIYFHFNPAGPR